MVKFSDILPAASSPHNSESHANAITASFLCKLVAMTKARSFALSASLHLGSSVLITLVCFSQLKLNWTRKASIVSATGNSQIRLLRHQVFTSKNFVLPLALTSSLECALVVCRFWWVRGHSFSCVLYLTVIFRWSWQESCCFSMSFGNVFRR